jgi:glycosyltransferase involved in cell wall biosynthesis
VHDQEHLGLASFRGVAPRVSVVILTHNEEANIASCLRSCAWSDDVHVVDSGSTDRTVQIARSMGATVHEHAFESFAAQRNWAIDHAGCTHRWQFHLDADERFTQGLVEEMAHVLRERAQGRGRAIGAYRVASKMIFMGKWLRRSGGYPAYQVRMIRVGKCRFVNFGHGQRELCEGQVGTLSEPYVHYSFSKGLVSWFDKHNQYSTREAEEAVAALRRGLPGLRQLFTRDATARRRAIKTFSYGLKFRALWRFLYSYGWRGGWLDGLAGLRYCLMVAMYEFWTELKIIEQRSRWREATDALTQRLMDGGAGSDEQWLGADTPADKTIDVIVPTYNEAGHIHQTVNNAQHVGPVCVLDSISNDGTQRIAAQAGATVVEHRFEGYARQKNWGLANLPLKGDWVFILDADERITPALRWELSCVTMSGTLTRGFFVNRQMIFMGQAIRFGGLYPSWNLRFFRRGSCWYEDRRVHEHMICDGPTEYLRHPMLHVRRETVWQYIQKHVKYADLESDEWVRRVCSDMTIDTTNDAMGHDATGLREQAGQEQGAAPAGALFRGGLRLRQWLRREVWPSVPMRPVVRFVWMYFVRLGVLDARAGWNLALLMASYEFMISLLYQEKLQRVGRVEAELILTREPSKERAA